VAQHIDVKYDTLSKAISQGRVADFTSSSDAESSSGTDRSQRSAEDAECEMGMACRRTVERTLSAVGGGASATTRFVASRGLAHGGVLFALPSLISCGLLRHLDEYFGDLSGYYTKFNVILLLAFMALCRIKSVEQLRNDSPGEMGRLMGLDRIPEVRCLRNKIKQLSDKEAVRQWHLRLSKEWMKDKPELTGVLYVDGHVRVYHGKQTNLPKRYVARDKLCMRGTTDYWINDKTGQPFFVVTKAVDGGLLRTLREDIIPQLLRDVPAQPSQQHSEDDERPYRFILVFDREGYSPEFFRQMWEKHSICCITYHKYPDEDWPQVEFQQTEITMPGGEEVTHNLAWRESIIGSAKKKLRVMEVRKLTKSGHQISVISPAEASLKVDFCGLLFNRWCQENFFRYMMLEYAIDVLSCHDLEELPETQRVINPRWRRLDSECRSLRGKLARKEHQFGQIELDSELRKKDYDNWCLRKSELREEVDLLGEELEKCKKERKKHSKHFQMRDLPEQEQFMQLATNNKLFRDTIKMIAYRAETAMANLLRDELGRPEDARSFLKGVYNVPIDLIPDEENNTLNVYLHHLSSPRYDRAVEALTKTLNEMECVYPGTQMKLKYSLLKRPNEQKQGSLLFPPNQEV